MMSENTVLSRIFTQNTFKDLINGRINEVYSTCIERYAKQGDNLDNMLAIEQIYKFIMKEYRNEYFYKNTLLNKLLLGKHSITTTVALTEIPINKSKADFVLINGKAVVYEIKTELDSFERLENQINDYYTAFKHVCVVTCESNYDKLNSLLKNSKAGIYILTNRNTVSTRKEPVEDNSKLNHRSIFSVLRKNEYEKIILNYYGELPETSQFNYYKECYRLFENIEIKTAYEYFIAELKARKLKEADEYKKVPFELKYLVYFSNFNKNDYMKLSDFLKMKISRR